MVDGPLPAGIILASMPDDAVPVEKVVTDTASRRQARRASRFLKGPILLSWIRQHIRDPADRLLLVLMAHSDMRQSAELKVTTDILRDAGIDDRKVAYRAIKRLEVSGSITVLRKRGRQAVVCLKEGRNDPVSWHIQKTT